MKRKTKHPEWLLCTTGWVNAYREAESKGLLGSFKEATWDKVAKVHRCCGSTQVWRHKSACPEKRINPNFGRVPGFKEWERLEMQEEEWRTTNLLKKG